MMRRPGPVNVVYMAHPVGAETPALVDANVQRALRWYAWLLDVEPDYAVTAPWLSALLGGIHLDYVAEHRERGLRDNVAIAARCDGIVLVGGRISSGMQRERDAVIAAGGWVADCTFLGDEPRRDVGAGSVHPIDAGRVWWDRR